MSVTDLKKYPIGSIIRVMPNGIKYEITAIHDDHLIGKIIGSEWHGLIKFRDVMSVEIVK